MGKKKQGEFKVQTTEKPIIGYDSMALDWSRYRSESEVTVLPSGSYKDMPESVMSQTIGHRCPLCEGELTWLNKTPFIWNSYGAKCNQCYREFRLSHKYLWPLVQEALHAIGVEAEEAEIVTPSDKSNFEQAVEAAHQYLDELAQAQAAVEHRKQAKAEAKRPKEVQARPGQAPGKLPLSNTTTTTDTPSDRTKNCVDCGKSFNPPARRGRPPVKCQDCGGWGT